MYLNMESDYAIRIVSCLARHQRIMSAKEISNCANVTLRFSLKILRSLVLAGLVESYKGANGGYKLAKPPKDISLYDVIKAIEGEYNISRCLQTSYVCSRNTGEKCFVHKVFEKISVYVRNKLDSVDFEMIVNDK